MQAFPENLDSDAARRLDRLWACLPHALDDKALDDLRQTFLGHRTGGARYLEARETRAAYAAYFFPQSVAKIVSVLSELKDLGVLGRPTSVLDLGAAMGPAAFAAWLFFPDALLSLVDFSGEALSEARRTGQALGARVATTVKDLSATDVGRADLVLVANALSELPTLEGRVALCRALLREKPAVCVIVEPADRRHARDLQALRDALLPHGFAPIAPCPHAGPCPASERPRDFCHQARPAIWPAWYAALQAKVGISDPRLRFSYLAYVANARPAHDPGVVRIISHPLKDKGRLRFLGCAAAGLVEMQRQDKHRSDANQAFDTLQRGARVRLALPARNVRIAADTAVQLLSEGAREFGDED